MTKKIALVGSAPSSVTRAPYDDPSYEIWACSPGAWPHCRRINTFFEIHSRTLDPAVFSTDYVSFLAHAPRTFVLEPWPELPNAILYPFDAMLKKWGPYWFSSTISWMFALAIEEGATEIGLWGIDMAAQEEYIGQRPACQWWMRKAKELGITITLPIESDLDKPFPLYGLVEKEPFYVKLMHRKGELMLRYQQAMQAKAKAEKEITFYEGAVDDINYMIHVWAADHIMQRYGIEPPQTVVKEEDIDPAVFQVAPSNVNWMHGADDILPTPSKPKPRRGRNGSRLEGQGA